MSEQKYDGNLDEAYEVSYGDVCIGLAPDQGLQWKYIRGVRIDGMDDGVQLTPRQALSLLAWLEQERDTLELLAKEQTEWQR